MKETKRWQVIAALSAALDRLYPCGTENALITSADLDDIDSEVTIVLAQYDEEATAREKATA